MSFLDTLLGRKHPPMIGLDISSSSVKLVELGQTASGEYVARAIRLRELRKGLDHRRPDREVRRGRRRRQAGRQQERHRTKHVVMAMPQSAVITKKIMLPAGLREEELELQVETEANQYIPFSLDEVSLDFCVIGPSPTSVGDVEVLIAASRKDRVQDRQGLAEAAGLKPVVLDIESHASRLAMSRVVATLPNEGKRRAGGAVRDRRRHHQPEGAARRRDALRPRPGLRRLAAHAADLAPVRLLVRGGRAEEARRRPARRLRVVDPRALRRQPVAGDRPRAAVLLHQHAAPQGALRDAGRRHRHACRA